MNRADRRRLERKTKKATHTPPGFAYAVNMESQIGLAEYRERKRVRLEMVRNREIVERIDARDSMQEIWMWGLFSLVLHRRYHWTAATIEKILSEVQRLHNDLWDQGETHEEISRKIIKMVEDEVGLKIWDEEMIQLYDEE